MRVLTLILLFCSCYFANAQVNTFNVGFLPNGTNPSGASTMIETDSGFVTIGFAPLGKMAVSFIDTNGNFVESKIYEDTTNSYYAFHYTGGLCKTSSNGYIFCIENKINDSVDFYLSRLIKFDENFDTIWQKEYFKDTLWSTPAQCLEESNGDYVVLGYNNNIANNSYDFLLYRTDSSGNLLWSKNYGGTHTEQGNLLLKTYDNGYLLGGNSHSFGSNSPHGNGEWYLVKTDSLGNQQWHKHYGNPLYNDDRIFTMCRTVDSCYLLAGRYIYEATGSTGIYKSRLVKINQYGHVIWDKRYGYKGRNNLIREVFQKNNGDIITISFTDSMSMYCGEVNNIIHCLTSSGDVKWRRKYYFNHDTCTSWSSPQTIKETSDGGLIFAGFGATYSLTPGQYTWVVKMDHLGFDGISYFQPDTTYRINQVSDTCYNDTIIIKTHLYGITAPYTITYTGLETHDSLYYSDLYYSYVEDSLILTPSIISAGIDSIENIVCTITDGLGRILTDTISVNVACIMKSKEIENTERNINIYPNPAKNIINIEIISINEELLLELFNSKGQCIHNTYLESRNEQIDISKYPSGIYLIKLSNHDFSHTEKIIINKLL